VLAYLMALIDQARPPAAIEQNLVPQADTNARGKRCCKFPQC
jgi:hypothetical protein